MSAGLFRGSSNPNQYTKGRRAADDAEVVGAVVAVDPSVLAGDVARIGEVTEVADKVPGTVKPPLYSIVTIFLPEEKLRRTHIVCIEVHNDRRPLRRRARRIIRKNLSYSSLAATLRANDEYAGWIWISMFVL